MIKVQSIYHGNKTLFNSEWKIQWFPNPEKNHCQFIGLDKVKEMIYDVDKPAHEKEETFSNVLSRLEDSNGDFEIVKIRGRLKFKFIRH